MKIILCIKAERGPRTRTASARIRAADTIFLLIENLNLVCADPRPRSPLWYKGFFETNSRKHKFKTIIFKTKKIARVLKFH
jgi:hypothetical protein